MKEIFKGDPSFDAVTFQDFSFPKDNPDDDKDKTMYMMSHQWRDPQHPIVKSVLRTDRVFGRRAPHEMLGGNQSFSPHLGGRDKRSTSIHMQQWEMQEKEFAAKSWTGGPFQVSTNHMKTEEDTVYSKY